MGILLGGAALLLAAAALHRLNPSWHARRVIEGLFRRALPGARTGRSEDAATTPSAAPPESGGRLRWAEVVNLTAAHVATPPRPSLARPEAAERTPVEQR